MFMQEVAGSLISTSSVSSQPPLLYGVSTLLYQWGSAGGVDGTCGRLVFGVSEAML